MKTLPQNGLPYDEVLAMLPGYGNADADYRASKIWSLVYHLNDEHTDFLKQAYGAYFSENALNPMAFQSLKRFETDIINMTAALLGGDGQTVGVMTSGGTESCLLPVLTYRELARSKRRRSFKPEMIAPSSIHVAWSKAAKYFGVKMVQAPLKNDFRVDLEAVRKLINRRTIMLVASAPSYPHGMIDPIEALGQVALQHQIPFHVDACLGGFLLPFMAKNGVALPGFDFQVPGVTSISADVHKYGFAAKGASTILYRNMDFLKHQFFIHEDWPGGVFASPALLGTRPGGAYAAAWAAMHALGEDGYRSNAREIMDVTQQLQSGIRSIEGLKVLGKPQMSVFAFDATDPGLNIYAVGDQMESRGWHIDRLQKPAALHLMVLPEHGRIVQEYLSDLEASVQTVRANPKLGSRGNAAMYGMIANLPFRGMIKNEVRKMMTEMYSPGGQMPMSGETNPWIVRILARLMHSFRSRTK